MSQAYLAKEVLAEIPDQVTGYMKKRGYKPRPPQQAPPPVAGHAPPPSAPMPSAPPPSAPPPAYGDARAY